MAPRRSSRLQKAKAEDPTPLPGQTVTSISEDQTPLPGQTVTSISEDQTPLPGQTVNSISEDQTPLPGQTVTSISEDQTPLPGQTVNSISEDQTPLPGQTVNSISEDQTPLPGQTLTSISEDQTPLPRKKPCLRKSSTAARTSICKDPPPLPKERPCITKSPKTGVTSIWADLAQFSGWKLTIADTIAWNEEKKRERELFKVNFCSGMKTYGRKNSIQESLTISSSEIKTPCETLDVHYNDGMQTDFQKKPILNTEANTSQDVLETTKKPNATSSQTEVQTPNKNNSSKREGSVELFDLNPTYSVSLEIVKLKETESIKDNSDVETELCKDQDDKVTPVREETNSSESENRETEPTSKSFLDYEAIEAGGYVSGESQDDEERRYIAENEIPIHGETLTSESELVDSNSDYERDSFVVSSAPEDYELLNTSSDLGDSDHELKMNKNSKQKYDERKLKEQKAASREIYLARHGPHPDDSSGPMNRTLKKKSSRLRCSEAKSQSTNENRSVTSPINMAESSKRRNTNDTKMAVQGQVIIDKKRSKKIIKRRHTQRIDSSDSEGSNVINPQERKNAERLDSDSETQNEETDMDVQDHVINDKGSSRKILKRRNTMRIDSSDSEDEVNKKTNLKNKQRKINSRRLDSDDQIDSDETNKDVQHDVLIDKKSPKKILKRKNTMRIDSSDSEDSTKTKFRYKVKRRRLESDRLVETCETSIDVVDQFTPQNDESGIYIVDRALINKNKIQKENEPRPSQEIDSNKINVVNKVINLLSQESQNSHDVGSSDSTKNNQKNNQKKSQQASDCLVVNDETVINIVDPVLNNEYQVEKQNVDSSKSNILNKITNLVSEETPNLQDDGGIDSNTKTKLKKKRKKMRLDSDCLVENNETGHNIVDPVLMDINNEQQPRPSEEVVVAVIVSEESQNSQDVGSSDSTKTNQKNNQKKSQQASDCLVVNDETVINIVDPVLNNEYQVEKQNVDSSKSNILNKITNLVSEETPNLQDDGGIDSNTKTKFKKKRKKMRLDSDCLVENNETGHNIVDPVLMDSNDEQQPRPSEEVVVVVIVSEESQNSQDVGSSDSTKTNLNDETGTNTNIVNPVLINKNEFQNEMQPRSSSDSNVKTKFKRSPKKRRLESDCLVKNDETGIEVVDHVKPGSSQDIARTKTAKNVVTTETKLERKRTLQTHSSDCEDNTKTNVKNKKKKNKAMQLKSESVVETSMKSHKIQAKKSVPKNIASDKRKVVRKVTAPVAEVSAPAAEASRNKDHRSDSSSSSIDIRTLLPSCFNKGSKKTKKSMNMRERIAREEEMLFRSGSRNISETPAEPARKVAKLISTVKASVTSISGHVGVIKPASTTVFQVSIEKNPHLLLANQ